MVTGMTSDDDALVLDALRRMGRTGATELRNELGIRSARVYRALDRLMKAGLVVDDWEHEPQGRPARRLYVVKGER
jgi:predicted transcriptional regulator